MRKCAEFAEDILADHMSSQTEAHVRECAECRSIRGLWLASKKLDLPSERLEPSYDMDVRIAQIASDEIRANTGILAELTRNIKFIGLAASLVLVFLTVILVTRQGGSAQKAPDRVIAMEELWTNLSDEKDLFELNTNIGIGENIICETGEPSIDELLPGIDAIPEP